MQKRFHLKGHTIKFCSQTQKLESSLQISIISFSVAVKITGKNDLHPCSVGTLLMVLFNKNPVIVSQQSFRINISGSFPDTVFGVICD